MKTKKYIIRIEFPEKAYTSAVFEFEEIDALVEDLGEVISGGSEYAQINTDAGVMVLSGEMLRKAVILVEEIK
jgi:hypothetical protein